MAILVGTALLIASSAVLDAPLQGPADLFGIPSENVKAPWVFVGIQFLLKFIHPLMAGIIIPLTGLMVLALLPFAGTSSPSRSLLFFAILITSTVLTVVGYVW